MVVDVETVSLFHGPHSTERGNPLSTQLAERRSEIHPQTPPLYSQLFLSAWPMAQSFHKRISRRILMKHLNEEGQGLTEYLILLMLVSIISIAAVRSLGSTIRSKIQVARDHINSEVSPDAKN